MANQTTNHLKLGVFVTLGLILFTVGIYSIGNKQNLFGNTIALSATFRNVNGLQPGNNVRYSGINIGTVENIRIVSDTSVQVNMVIEESASIHIRKDAIATISSDGLVGNMIVSLLPTENQLPPVASGDTIQSYSRIGADDLLTTLNVTNENAALLTADLLKITEGILERKGALGVLLYDSTLGEDLKATLHNLKVSSQNINNATRKINASVANLDNPEGLLSKISNDTMLISQLSQTMANLQIASEEISSVTERLNTLAEDSKNENGTIQTLIYDTAFVYNLKESMGNIKLGTERFSENMEALKHNFLTRRYFKKKAKEEKQ